MGVMGGSYGEALTNWTITLTDLCSGVYAALHRLTFDSRGLTTLDRRSARNSQYDALPWMTKKRSWRNRRLLMNVKTPTLILRREEDHRCPHGAGGTVLRCAGEVGVPTSLLLPLKTMMPRRPATTPHAIFKIGFAVPEKCKL